MPAEVTNLPPQQPPPARPAPVHDQATVCRFRAIVKMELETALGLPNVSPEASVRLRKMAAEVLTRVVLEMPR
jgi:hypothetical protein